MPKPYPRVPDDVVAVARKAQAPIAEDAKNFGIDESCLRNGCTPRTSRTLFAKPSSRSFDAQAIDSGERRPQGGERPVVLASSEALGRLGSTSRTGAPSARPGRRPRRGTRAGGRGNNVVGSTLSVFNEYSATCPAEQVLIGKNTGPWPVGSVTWNNAPGIAGPVMTNSFLSRLQLDVPGGECA